MIVGINYNSDGSRYIATIAQGSDWTQQSELVRAKHFLDECDEVYIIGIDVTDKNFINAIVCDGCRIGV